MDVDVLLNTGLYAAVGVPVLVAVKDIVGDAGAVQVLVGEFEGDTDTVALTLLVYVAVGKTVLVEVDCTCVLVEVGVPHGSKKEISST